jgi:hypothetical protein
VSCYEWERGSIKIPRGEWAGLKKAINDAANSKRKKLLDTALRVHKALTDRALKGRIKDAVKAHNKKMKGKPDSRIGLREVTPEAIFEAVTGCGHSRLRINLCEALGVNSGNRGRVPSWLSALQVAPPRRRGNGLGGSYYEHDDDEDEQIDTVRDLIFTKTDDGVRLRKPQKGHEKIKLLPLKTARYAVGWEATITLDHKARTVTWDVGENNHACESARAHPMGEAFFKALGRITWTRGSGGKIVGNDEYNRHEGRGEEGGGGNYVTAEYGPERKAKKRRNACRRYA